MRILMNLNASKETFRNHRGILRTCFFPPFLSGPRARLLRLGRLGPRQGNQRNRSTCENSGRNESLRPFTTDAHDHLLPVCFVQQGASSSNGATVPAAEPLKPKLQVRQNEKQKKVEKASASSITPELKSTDGRLCFFVSEADGVPPAPPAKAGVHVGVAGARLPCPVASAASLLLLLARDAQAERCCGCECDERSLTL